MKNLLLVASLCLLTPVLAHAEGELASERAQVKVPGETVEVAPESSTGLFERVREAHVRAVQKGSVASGQKS